jgi:hypothetical protein
MNVLRSASSLLSALDESTKDTIKVLVGAPQNIQGAGVKKRGYSKQRMSLWLGHGTGCPLYF